MGSKRDARKHPTDPLQVVNAGIEWAPDADPIDPDSGGTAPAVAHADQVTSDRAFLERIFGVDRSCCVDSVSSSRHFTPQDHERSVKVATAHPAVAPFLDGRWAVLGADQVWTRSDASRARQSVRVHVFNYTSNDLIDVLVEDDRVTSVDQRGVYEYPESPQEMGTAIDLARAHPDLKDEVRDLVGHAILRVPSDARDPTTSHRCMWVIFTDHDEPVRQLPVRFTALVDLGSMEVVACGATLCDSTDAGDPARKKS